MMKDPAKAVCTLLQTAGVGTFAATSGWNLCVGVPPAAPDTSIICNSTGGKNPFPHLAYNEPSVSVVVRGAKNGYAAARTKAEAVVDALLGMSSTTVDTDVYRACNQLGDIIWLGVDDNSRPMFSANFWFIVLPAASGNRSAIT